MKRSGANTAKRRNKRWEPPEQLFYEQTKSTVFETLEKDISKLPIEGQEYDNLHKQSLDYLARLNTPNNQITQEMPFPETPHATQHFTVFKDDTMHRIEILVCIFLVSFSIYLVIGLFLISWMTLS